MAKYHVNPESGEVSACRARKACPFGDMDKDHYSSKDEARKSFERTMGNEAFDSFKKSHVESVNNTYNFPSYKAGAAKSAIDKANRRAERAGIAERFTYAIRTYDVKGTDKNGFSVFEERAELILNRPTVEHEGWKFAGTLSWDEEVGMVSRLSPGEELLDLPRARECDVCHTNRHRVDTYIVQKDGGQKQVGSNCLQQFMGVKPQGLWMLDYDLKVDDRDDRAPQEKWQDQRRDSVEAMGLGLAVVEEYGWHSRSGAAYDAPTADVVGDIYAESQVDREQQLTRDKLRARGVELEGEAKNLLEEARNVFPINDYMSNLKTISSGESVSMRNLPTFLSAISAIKKQKERESEQKIAAQSQWVGNVGDKIENHKILVEDIRDVTNYYGYNPSSSRLITMKDDQGNTLKWFSSGNAIIDKGKSYQMKGTIKKHDEYKGSKQTLLTRVKLLEA
jgi:hypothetical protein